MFEWSDVSLSFGEKSVLRGCSIRGEGGARLALMGPSGCGKTTLLRVALALQQPDGGSFRSDAGRIAAVFQEPRLLPWLTAEENVNLVLSDSPATLADARGWPAVRVKFLEFMDHTTLTRDIDFIVDDDED